MNSIKRKKLRIAAVIVIALLVLTVGGCMIYASDYYHADTQRIEVFLQDLDVDNILLPGGGVAYGKPDAEIGLIFYPGGKVEHTAYEPLMCRLAAGGIFCVLTEMPFHLAVLDMNAADGVIAMYPEIDCWYIGGHSLGGAMAASYATENSERLAGVVLLGAYSSANLSNTGLRVLSLYGREDKIMNRKKYDEYKGNLPEKLTEIVIEGGCHAYFGMYGEQDGDGMPTLHAEEQIVLTADYITQWITEGEK